MSKDNRKNEVCSNESECSVLKAEREHSIESLIAHLSEQRHDFFNLLQVLYGYTQLEKSEKVLEHISDYCRYMGNIGRLYNGKCIKLADLLYTKGKEAESIDMNLEISVDISFDSVIRILDNESVLQAVDHILSAFYYMLDTKGYKEVSIMYNLGESEEAFLMEIYCKEIRDGQLEPSGFSFPDKQMHWKKIERDIMKFDMIEEYCNDNGLEGKVLEEEAAFELRIYK